jgi:hypothetical protein
MRGIVEVQNLPSIKNLFKHFVNEFSALEKWVDCVQESSKNRDIDEYSPYQKPNPAPSRNRFFPAQPDDFRERSENGG